jgi:hypothetical protein
MGVKLHELVTREGQHYSWAFRCPACRSTHQCDNRWGFNGDKERPTFTGSVLVHAANVGTADRPIGRPLCHSFVSDGKITYLADCTHAMAGHQDSSVTYLYEVQ